MTAREAPARTNVTLLDEEDSTPDAARWRRLVRRPAMAVALGVAALLLAALTVPRGDTATFLDPRSAGDDGASVLMDLASIHRQVDMLLEPQTDTSTALVLRDRLNADQRQALDRWVRAGGVLVVLDPDSALAAPRSPSRSAVGLGGPLALDAGCTPPDPAAVTDPVRASVWALFDVDDPLATCFRRSDGVGLVVVARGRGWVLSFGAPTVVTNQSIGEPGHPALAAALVTHGPPGPLAVIEPGPPAAAGASAIDLVPARAWQAMGLLGLALLLAMAATGRRHGRPVVEDVPVTVRGSDLTRAAAELFAATGDRTHAGNQLRRGVHRALQRRLPGAVDQPPRPDQLRALAVTLSLPAEVVELAVAEQEVDTDEELVRVARATAALHGRLTPGDS